MLLQQPPVAPVRLLLRIGLGMDKPNSPAGYVAVIPVCVCECGCGMGLSGHREQCAFTFNASPARLHRIQKAEREGVYGAEASWVSSARMPQVARWHDGPPQDSLLTTSTMTYDVGCEVNTAEWQRRGPQSISRLPV
jgi:hypothetical protein